ncbi:MAG: hypothetical protein O7F76_09495 [Planctomycetota bacterium]|nr:hypothetical protein [Planctomycetota bacterium]
MAKKTRKKMSAAARRKISLAQKARWAAFRKGKSSTGGRLGRPRAAASANNPYMNMTVQEFVAAKRQMDAAWKAAKKLLRKR